MRSPFAAPPEAEELGAKPVHAVLRDFPEVLAVLRRLRVDPGARGGDALKEAVGEDGLESVEEAVTWRRSAAHRPRQSEGPTEVAE